ncbi:MAG TPA: sulfatase-like hydrolase/transferase, partial [Fimbriiglobus sp.]|nr:sulfatase-like hydrolase/transferase [Fimbriiglobus sp.]
MPRVQELLAAQGVTFNNSFVTSPICLPSNVTSLTGQYTFTHGVLNNLYPTGGFQKFADLGGDQSTLATWLDDAGYNTARVGKYLVEYPLDSTYIPPGWDEWYSTGSSEVRYFNYALNDNGQLAV